MPRRKRKEPVFNYSYHYNRADHWADGVIRKLRELPSLTGRPKAQIARMFGISVQAYKEITTYENMTNKLPWPCINMIERYYAWAKRHMPYFEEKKAKAERKRKRVVYLNADYDTTTQNA